jgi:hypothetical protein
MTTRTPTELAKNVLLHLNICDAQSSPSAADNDYLIARYRDIYEELSEDHIAYWPADEIPRVVFEPLTQYMALCVSKPFGVSVAASEMEEGLRIFRRRLRRHTHRRSAELPATFEDF